MNVFFFSSFSWHINISRIFSKHTSQMGFTDGQTEASSEEHILGTVMRMSVAPVCFSLWGFSSQQPEFSLLPPHVLLEVAFPLLSNSCQKPHPRAMSDARWEINNRYFLVAVYSVCRSIFHLTQSSTALLWHTNALPCPGLYCFSAKEPNKSSSKKASSSVSPFYSLQMPLLIFIYMCLFFL